jgi:hypothetical protein
MVTVVRGLSLSLSLKHIGLGGLSSHLKMIAVLAGYDVPIVLRYCEKSSYKVIGDYDDEFETYKAVGDSYIHGIMDGEAERKRRSDI